VAYGHGDGDGDGDGYGYGDGDGDGSGSGDGYGYGDGYGSGDGDGCGYGSGSGYGYGYGDGNGHGDGYGYGDGCGYGSGRGSADGDGDGDGDGTGIYEINGERVYKIDGVQTIIRKVKGNIAKGFILTRALTLTPTYVAKVGDCFAHGETAAKALHDATEKSLINAPAEERIRIALAWFDISTGHTGKEWLNFHRAITGSCEQGCKSFASDRGIDLDKPYTLAEFISAADGAYPRGQEAIDILKQKLQQP
jgi:hypothetical protein